MDRDIDEIISDGRDVGDYHTRYTDPRCREKIRRDAIIIFGYLCIALLIIFCNFLEVFEIWLGLAGEKKIIFHKVIYCVSAGLLGGATFGLKYFYSAREGALCKRKSLKDSRCWAGTVTLSTPDTQKNCCGTTTARTLPRPKRASRSGITTTSAATSTHCV